MSNESIPTHQIFFIPENEPFLDKPLLIGYGFEDDIGIIKLKRIMNPLINGSEQVIPIPVTIPQ